VEAEDFTGAIAVYQRAATVEPKNPNFFYWLLTGSSRKFQQPWQLIDRRLPSTPTMPIFYALATVWEFRGQCRCGDSHRRTIELDRNYLNAYLGLGGAASGNYNAALGHTSKCSPANLIMPMLMNWWVRCWCSRDAQSDRSTPKVSNAGSKTPVCFCSWDLFVSQGNITAGLMTLKKGCPGRSAQCKSLQMGEILRAQNDLDGALSAYRQALTVQPIQQKHRQLSVIFYWLRDFIPAITAYHRLIQLSSQNANAYYNLGIALQAETKPGSDHRPQPRPWPLQAAGSTEYKEPKPC